MGNAVEEQMGFSFATDEPEQQEGETFIVPAWRLAWGVHEKREGDISAAYSADKIADKGSKIRTPFRYAGKLWCTVGMAGSAVSGHDKPTASAYQLVSLRMFNGETTDYNNHHLSPSKGYHGMKVSRGGTAYVLVGPGCTFVSDGSEEEAPQEGLFGDISPEDEDEEPGEDDEEGGDCDACGMPVDECECDCDLGFEDLEDEENE